jgi:hypothetical protein
MPGIENWGYPYVTGDVEFNAYSRASKVLRAGF